MGGQKSLIVFSSSLSKTSRYECFGPFQLPNLSSYRLLIVAQTRDCCKIVILLTFHVLGFVADIVVACILSPMPTPPFLLVSFICRLPLSYLICLLWLRTSKESSKSYFDRQIYQHVFETFFAQNGLMICPLALACVGSTTPISLSLWLSLFLIDTGTFDWGHGLGDLKNWTPDSGDLATKARCLVSLQGYRWSDIYISPFLVSERNTLGCCFRGFNKTYILLDETLLKQNTDKIISVLAHEIGHWKGNHSLKALCVNYVSMGVYFHPEVC